MESSRVAVGYIYTKDALLTTNLFPMTAFPGHVYACMFAQVALHLVGIDEISPLYALPRQFVHQY